MIGTTDNDVLQQCSHPIELNAALIFLADTPFLLCVKGTSAEDTVLWTHSYK